MLYQQPEQSPWGKVQTCDVLCPGVFLVSTASHGGTMVAKDMAAVLSPAAIKCGFRQSGFSALRKIRRKMLPCGSFWIKAVDGS